VTRYLQTSHHDAARLCDERRCTGRLHSTGRVTITEQGPLGWTVEHVCDACGDRLEMWTPELARAPQIVEALERAGIG